MQHDKYAFHFYCFLYICLCMSVWPEQQVLGVVVTVITGDKYLNSSLCLDGSWKIFTVDGNWSYLLYKPECTSQWDSKEWGGYRRQTFVYVWESEHKTEMAHQGGREAVKKTGKFNYGDKMVQLLMETCSLLVNQSQIDCRIGFSSRDASVYADLENTSFFQWGRGTIIKLCHKTAAKTDLVEI